MRRKTAFLGALALTGGLVAFAPSGAHAVTGVITYHTRPENRPHEILDPGDDHCYGVGDGYGEVDNDTPTDLVLYTGRDCTGRVVTVVRARSWLNARFGSLQLSANGPREPVTSADEDRRDDQGRRDDQDRSDSPDRSDGQDSSDSPDRSDDMDASDTPGRSDVARDSTGSADPSDSLDHSEYPEIPQDADGTERRERPASSASASPVDPVNAGNPGRPGRQVRPVRAG
ncbi:chitin-binding protein [Streptomyces nigrescens]